MSKVNVMWFSRNEMTTEQEDALVKSIHTRFGEDSHIVIKQVNGTAANVHVAFMATNEPESQAPTIKELVERGKLDVVTGTKTLPTAHKPLKELVKEFDIVAAVLPINLQEQILPFMGDAPLLTASSERVMNSNGKPTFVFQKWVQVLAVKIETQDY
jgi:hypothetical protein